MIETTTQELLDEVTEMWSVGKPFYLTGVVSAPYSGCFHEPQIWLVVPEDDPMEWRYFTEATIVGLYATGQGAEVTKKIHTLEDLLAWLREQHLPDLAIIGLL